MIFDKVKKMAKESYFNLELELNKNNLKKTWEIFRKAIHKQNKRPTIPDTFIINGKSNSGIRLVAPQLIVRIYLLLKNSYLEAYESQIQCINPRCTDCCDK